MPMITDRTNLLPSSQSHFRMEKSYPLDSEELTSESEGEFDDMAELSDSPSSHVSSSRPTTPSHHHLILADQPISPPRIRSRSSSSPPIDTTGPICLAQKAERILGLIPGTLPHAQACLENAKDEVRRTSEDASFDHTFGATVIPPANNNADQGNGGVRSRFDRARKVMSVHLPNGSTANGGGVVKVPGVVVGIGGREEEERRERRRRAADGVIYWQREVAKLREIEAVQNKTVKGRSKR